MNRDVILVVDDEPAVLATYRDYLMPRPAAGAVRSSRVSPPPATPATPATYRLLLASSGEEAVEMVTAERERGGHVCAGFFDMRMSGGIDGLTTIRRVRALDPGILVAIVTAHQDSSLDEIAPIFAGGHDDEWDYLNKPFTEAEITQKARNLVASWHRRRREEHYLAELVAVNRSLEDRVAERTDALRQKAEALEAALAGLKGAQRQLVHGERLAAIGQLCAGLAHEINTPATSALLDIRHLLRCGAVADADLVPVLLSARDGVQRIADLSRELRVFAHDDEGRMEPLDPNEVVERALRVANQVLQAHGDLVIRRGRPPRVRGDAGQLVQVVVLLLLNAAKSLDPRRRADNLVSVVTEERDGRALISVADNGPGVPPEIVERAFEPFVSGAGTGAGLGLSVARRLVENHGGTITLETELSRGSAFRVSLPALAMPQRARPAAAPASPLPESGARPRVRLLFVDDDAPLLASYQRLLSRRYEVETALGAEPAIEAISRDPSFDAVLCDVMMPRTSGIDLFRTLGERWPALAARVVFLTGGTFTREAQEELERTGRPCLFKPFDVDELEACLAAVLAGAASSGTAG